MTEDQREIRRKKRVIEYAERKMSAGTKSPSRSSCEEADEDVADGLQGGQDLPEEEPGEDTDREADQDPRSKGETSGLADLGHRGGSRLGILAR